MITHEIGNNAGEIWNLLNNNGHQPVKKMMRKLKLNSKDFYMAMGWLAREGKIFHYEDEGEMITCLKE